MTSVAPKSRLRLTAPPHCNELSGLAERCRESLGASIVLVSTRRPGRCSGVRIFLTGVTGLLGRAMARQLIAAGHAVTGIAAYPHHNLHPDVDFVCAPLGDPVLEQLADASDVVLHLAPVETAVPGSAGINGLVRVAHAATRTGARLILLPASAGQPTLLRQAESLISSSWAPSLVVRITPPMGRHLYWM